MLPISFVIFILGICLGSFLNVCIYRIPKGRDIITVPSSCPHCRSGIRLYDNIPLVSFFLLKGKCRDCGQPISWQYPFVELVTGVFAVLLFLKFGLTLTAFVYFILICSLIVVSVIDLREMIIPDSITLPGIVIGLASSFILPNTRVIDALLGVIAGGGILAAVGWGYYLCRQKIGLGAGDILLITMIGAFLGFWGVITTLFIASIIGGIVGLIFIKTKGGSYQIPFGPALSAGGILSIFLVDFYMRILVFTVVPIFIAVGFFVIFVPETLVNKIIPRVR